MKKQKLDQKTSENKEEQHKIDLSILDEKVGEMKKVKKDLNQEELIEKADQQLEEEQQKLAIQMEFKKISKELTPVYSLIFGALNQFLKSKEIRPLDEIEQRKIIQSIDDFTSSAISEVVERAENIAVVSKNAPRFFRLFDIIINIIVPRIVVYQKIKKAGE